MNKYIHTLLFGAILIFLNCNGQDATNIIKVGTITQPEITECSGIIPCGKDTNLFWVNTDGPRSVIFAINLSGKCVSHSVISGAPVVDFEDIARDDKGHIFIGDIGNNDARRRLLAVYMIDEPDTSKPTSVSTVKQSWRLTFPGKPFDCESLFIYKENGYVISKVFNNSQAEIYRFALSDTNKFITLSFITKLQVKSPVTGADISTDGNLLALTAKNGVYLFEINQNLDSAAKIKPYYVRFTNKHIEGCCFVPNGLVVTSEDRSIYLFTHNFFHPDTVSNK
ncbi:MAG TPA: hypothetical protein PLW02_03425 [Verrucomicrobiota bacterium]|mgnify:CR=1 FL=1|nr:hypothetical protein [Verrucomicrobiota bacterium]